LVGKTDRRTGAERRDGGELQGLEGPSRFEQLNVDGQALAQVHRGGAAKAVARILREQMLGGSLPGASPHHLQKQRLQLRAG
jgi:hypothetical protein